MTTRSYALVIPVKDGGSAKSRLGVGGAAQRARLMAAFARDAISAAAACERVTVHVVGDEAGLAGVLADLDVEVLPDEGGGDLNAALAHAAVRVARAEVGIAVMLADLPCLRTEDLTAALDAADAVAGRSFVADADGTGTTLLVVPPGAELDPRFGAGSATAHAASGATRIGDGLASLRRDVDTTDDLASALQLGVGVHTAAVTSGLARHRPA